MAYICNVDEDAASEGNSLSAAVQKAVKERAASRGGKGLEEHVVVLSAALEGEAATFETEEEQNEYLQMAGLEETGLDRVNNTF